MTGVINVYKPTGWSSADVVAKLKGVLHERRIGHGGTLDPDAEGLLPVCVGSATKLFDYLTSCKKEYIAEICFGASTDTQDGSGNIISVSSMQVDNCALDVVLPQFSGKIKQIPPMYSALKRNGKRLCDLARKGETVELDAREVVVYEIERLTDIEENSCMLRIVCGKGTYIRTLCHDIGKLLGCGAYMKSLKRTKAGNMRIENSFTISQLEQMMSDGDASFLVSIEDAVDFLPRVEFEESALSRLQNGNETMKSRVINGCTEQNENTRIFCDGRFIGIGALVGENYVIKHMLRGQE